MKSPVVRKTVESLELPYIGFTSMTYAAVRLAWFHDPVWLGGPGPARVLVSISDTGFAPSPITKHSGQYMTARDLREVVALFEKVAAALESGAQPDS